MGRPLYVVIHLYKTAGKALLRNFQQNLRKGELLSMYAPQIGLDKAQGSANPGWNEDVIVNYLRSRLNDQVKCLFGHMAFYGIHELPQVKQREVRYITFLRDPVSRIISLYNYLKYNSTNVWHDEIIVNNWSIEEWLCHSRGLWINNGQLRHLLLWQCKEVTYQRQLTQEHLRLGKEIIDNMWFVGTKETFDTDLQFICGLLDFKYCSPDERINVSAGDKKVDSTIIEQIEQINDLDRDLYNYARQARKACYERYNDNKHEKHFFLARYFEFFRKHRNMQTV
jgi:hypothetical protein